MPKRSATSPPPSLSTAKKAKEDPAIIHITSRMEPRAGETPTTEQFSGKRLAVYEMLRQSLKDIEDEPLTKSQLAKIKLRIASSIGMLTVMDLANLEALDIDDAAGFVIFAGHTAEELLDRCKLTRVASSHVTYTSSGANSGSRQTKTSRDAATTKAQKDVVCASFAHTYPLILPTQHRLII